MSAFPFRVRGRLAMAAFAALLLAPPAALAAGASARVSVDPDPVGTSERLTVSIEVEGEGAPSAQVASFPLIDGLRRLGGASASQATQVVIDGGGMRRSTTRRIDYSFLPERAGQFTIPPLDVKVGAETVRTAPRVFTVVDGAGAAPRSRGRSRPNDPFDQLLGDRFGGGRAQTRAVQIPEMTVERKVEPRKVYLGEPATLTVELWVGPAEGHIEQAGPVSGTDRTGFWIESLKVDTSATARTEERGGKVYTVFELSKQLLYPTEAGRLPLEEETWRVIYRPSVLSLLSPAQEVFPKAEQIAIEVAPLPEKGRPPGYAGLVGEFEVRSQVDRERGKVGDAITWIVTLSGRGNLRTAGELRVPKPEGFDVFSSKANDEVHPSVSGIEGKRTTEQVLIPRNAGTLTVPALEVPFFDPKAGAYRTASAPSHTVTVVGAPAAGVIALPEPTAAARAVRQGNDIRYIQPASRGLAPERWLGASAGFWALALAAPLVNGALWVRRRRLVAEGRDPAGQRKRRAYGRLASVLADNALADADGLARVSGAFATYLGDRFSVPSVEVTAMRLRARAAQYGVPQRHVEDLVALLADLDAARFGGGGVPVSDLAARVKRLAGYLEGAR